MSAINVLIVSERSAWPSLEEALTGAGCQVYAARSGDEALPLAQRLAPAVVLMGPQVPGTDALDVCRRIRGQLADRAAPFFLLAPEQASEDGSETAAVVDEREPARRLARSILSLLDGHLQPAGSRDVLDRGGLRIDRRRHEVTLHQRRLPLTVTEFRIVWALAERPGYVVSRRQLTDACRRADNPVQERTIDVHIKSIRRKLKSEAWLIETVRGVGYRLCETPPAPTGNRP